MCVSHALFSILNHIELSIQRVKCVPESNCSWFIIAVGCAFFLFFFSLTLPDGHTTCACVHTDNHHFEYILSLYTENYGDAFIDIIYELFSFNILSVFYRNSVTQKNQHLIYLMLNKISANIIKAHILFNEYEREKKNSSTIIYVENAYSVHFFFSPCNLCMSTIFCYQCQSMNWKEKLTLNWKEKSIVCIEWHVSACVMKKYTYMMKKMNKNEQRLIIIIKCELMCM